MDLRSRQKKNLEIIFLDGTKINVFMPSKMLFEELSNFNMGSGDTAVGEMYGMAAKLMSRNAQGETFSKEKLEEMLDFEDLIEIVRAYSDFVTEVIQNPN